MYSNTARKKPRLIGELNVASDRLGVSDFNYRRGAEIFGEAEPAAYIYQVVEGAVRTHKLLPDGRRQIGAFYFPGDIFGLENDDTHHFTAEAIVATTVHMIKRRELDAVAQNDPAIFRTILGMTTGNLAHAEDHILLLGRKTSLERVASFLLEMHLRSTSAGVVNLPMNRRDIADYLGLTLETVSRAMSELYRKDVVKFDDTTRRHVVVVLDVDALVRLADERSQAS
ncbi:helix-turn-helix domain-containing protein [Bradyrhizobium sp. URHC0002]